MARRLLGFFKGTLVTNIRVTALTVYMYYLWHSRRPDDHVRRPASILRLLREGYYHQNIPLDSRRALLPTSMIFNVVVFLVPRRDSSIYCWSSHILCAKVSNHFTLAKFLSDWRTNEQANKLIFALAWILKKYFNTCQTTRRRGNLC